MDKLDEGRLKYVAGGSDGGGAADALKKAQDAFAAWQNEVPKAGKPTDRNDKAGWKAWWEYRRRRPFACVTGTCARCGKRIGTNGSLCRECRDWVYG